MELVVRRVIAASPDRLFSAWTEPALLVQWWGPAGVKCIGAEIDLRVGGAYRIGNELPDGRVLWIEGVFEVVDRPRTIVYSWQIGDEPPSRVTVTFTAVADKTEVTIHHERVHTTAARDDHERGWHGCLDGLANWA